MGFKTETRTVRDLFQRQCRYVIPRYQRGYVWTKQNWNELYSDIIFTLKVEDNIAWSHFLGTIVLNTNQGKTGIQRYAGIEDLEIIDGQQRVTTLYILFLALHKNLLLLGTEESENRSNYIHSSFIVSLSADNQPVLMIENPELKTDFEILHDAAINPERKIPKSNSLYNAFTYFSNELSKYSFNELDNFIDKLLEINLVEIISDQEEEIYNIFEVLNARGQQLKQIELLKNHIMKYIQPREDEFIDQSREKWNQIMKNVENISDPDDMINHFAKCYIKKKAENKESVYKLIKSEVNIHQLSNLLDSLLAFSTTYKDVTETNTKDFVIKYFNIKRNRQVRSILTAIAESERKKIITEKVKNETYKNIRNFYFIYNAMGETSNRLDTIISDFAYEIYHASTETEFKMIVNDLFFELNKFISFDKFSVSFNNNVSFQYSNQDKKLKRNNQLVKYTLCEYCNNFQRDSKLDPDSLTIEHLLNDNGPTLNARIENLTLTSQDINNNILKDKSVDKKIDILETQSQIEINRHLSKYLNEDLTFDSERRHKDITKDLFNTTFKFKTELYGIAKEDLDTYNLNNAIVRDDEELLTLLKNRGKNFEIALERDPKLTDLSERYNQLKSEYDSIPSA